MALYDTVRSKIARQELNLIVDGPNYKHYSAKVKYLPENVEKEDFFSLCCGVLKPGDMVTVRTAVNKTDKKESYDVIYNYLVISADPEANTVVAHKLSKVDLLNPVANVEVEGVDTEALNKAIDTIVEAKVKTIVEELDSLKADVNNCIEDIEKLIEAVSAKEAEEDTETSEDEDKEEEASEDNKDLVKLDLN